MKFADLHLHTVFSDGTYTPAGLVKEAKAQGLSSIAVADHDTVKGIIPTLEAAKRLDLEIIPGIELTAEYEGLEIHFLGYLIDYQHQELIERLELLYQNRIERIYKITGKLKEQGVDLEAKSVFEVSQEGSPGRLHIARALLAKGKVNSIYEAFQKLIGDKCPAYVSGFKLSPLQAMELIKDSGGVAVLAHPYSIRKDELIPELVSQGLMGLEVYYPEHSQAMVNFYLDLAKKYNLLVTGGSDCHGSAKPEVKIGSIKIPYELVEKMKERVTRN